MRNIFLMANVLLLTACVSSGMRFSSVSPMGLETFPFDTATQETVFQTNGPPTDIITLPNGNTGWVYEFGHGFGKKTYTVEISSDKKIIDVFYHDQGPYNGVTARSLQK